jgi:hypothetical protein
MVLDERRNIDAKTAQQQDIESDDIAAFSLA